MIAYFLVYLCCLCESQDWLPELWSEINDGKFQDPIGLLRNAVRVCT